MRWFARGTCRFRDLPLDRLTTRSLDA
jgi:hypothetical protein